MSEDVIGVKAVLDLSGWTPNVKKVIDDTGNAEKSMGDMAKTFNDKLRVVENSIGAVTAAYVVFDRAISQGEGVIQGKALFTAMAGGAQQAAAGEEELRQTTRGLVDDQVALAGASKLLTLHLADNVDQASKIVGLGAQLGKVFLQDAAGGINAFDTALANTSARGLQQLGISYDEVVAKQKKLEAQGMSTRDAFRTAMLEVATEVRDSLGDSVVMAGTALDRIKIKLTDTIDSVLEAAAVGFENTVNLVDISVNNIGRFTNAAQRQVDALNASAQASLAIVSNAQRTLSSADFHITPGQVPTSGTVAGGAIVQQIIAQERLNASIETSNRLEEMRNANLITARNLIDAAARRQQLANDAEYNNLEAIRAATAQQAREQAQAQQDYNNAVEQSTGSMMVILQDQNRLTDMMLQARGTFEGTPLFTDQEAANARNIATSAQQAFQQISDLKQRYPNMVSEADVQQAQAIYQNTQRWADQAERGAQAFDNMNLSQLLGQQSGGPAGEIVNMVETSVGTLNLTADKLKEIKDAMELVTGQQTAASEALQNEIVPALANISQSNATAAAQSAVAIQNYAQAQALAGKAVTEAGMLNAGGLGINPNAGSRQITVTAGQSASEAARANNITIPQLLATTGALNVYSVPQGTFTMNGGTAVLPLQGPGTTFGGGAGTLAQQGGLIAPTGPGMATGPGAPLVNGQQQITDAATNVQTTVSTTASVVNDKTVAMGTDMSTLNTTGQTQLTGPTGLTAWWDQLQTMVTNVYNTIMPLINNMQQGMTGINSAAQNLNNVPSNYANNTTVNPNTGRGYAVGGRITDTSVVGEYGRELFTPSRAGYIVNAANTESILSALAGVLNGGGGNHVNNNQRTNTFNQYVTVQGNAQAASAMMGVTDALRGFG